MDLTNIVIKNNSSAVKLNLFCPLTIRTAYANWEHKGGFSSLVLIEKQSKRVIKLTVCRATNELLKKQLIAKTSGLPQVIKDFGIIGSASMGLKPQCPVYAFEIEYLTAMPDEAVSRLCELIFSYRMNIIKNSLSGIGEPELSIETIEKFIADAPDNVQSSLKLVQSVSKETGGRFDMQNLNNWMQRSDGSIVMSDPVILPN